MNSKTFRLIVFLLLTAFAVVGVSGCGGSSSDPLGTQDNSGGGGSLSLPFLMKMFTMLTMTEFLTL